VRDSWDGVNLKFTFRRTMDREIMEQWLEVIQIASCLQFTEEKDALVWQYNSTGKYSIQQLYAIVNDRGVSQIYTTVMWKIPVPSRLHLFFWLLANNKVLTRDNIAKRKQVDDRTCLFCNENEIVLHLFFDCCIAQLLWRIVSEIADIPLIKDFESLGSIWIRGRNFRVHNVLSSAIIWTIWKTRNNPCFQGMAWTKVEAMMYLCAKFLRSWSLLNKTEDKVVLEAREARPPRLEWRQDSGSSLSNRSCGQGSADVVENVIGSSANSIFGDVWVAECPGVKS
jgi:hypothetical protein